MPFVQKSDGFAINNQFWIEPGICDWPHLRGKQQRRNRAAFYQQNFLDGSPQ